MHYALVTYRDHSSCGGYSAWDSPLTSEFRELRYWLNSIEFGGGGLGRKCAIAEALWAAHRLAMTVPADRRYILLVANDGPLPTIQGTSTTVESVIRDIADDGVSLSIISMRSLLRVQALFDLAKVPSFMEQVVQEQVGSRYSSRMQIMLRGLNYKPPTPPAATTAGSQHLTSQQQLTLQQQHLLQKKKLAQIKQQQQQQQQQQQPQGQAQQMPITSQSASSKYTSTPNFSKNATISSERITPSAMKSVSLKSPAPHSGAISSSAMQPPAKKPRMDPMSAQPQMLSQQLQLPGSTHSSNYKPGNPTLPASTSSSSSSSSPSHTPSPSNMSTPPSTGNQRPIVPSRPQVPQIVWQGNLRWYDGKDQHLIAINAYAYSLTNELRDLKMQNWQQDLTIYTYRTLDLNNPLWESERKVILKISARDRSALNYERYEYLHQQCRQNSRLPICVANKLFFVILVPQQDSGEHAERKFMALVISVGGEIGQRIRQALQQTKPKPTPATTPSTSSSGVTSGNSSSASSGKSTTQH